nr:cupin domain-containing protein [Microbacterium amylolyticum]
MSGDSRDFGDFYQHPEDEFVTVLSGMIVIDLGEDIAPVSVGESRYIRGNTPHRWASPDGAAYRVMIVKERMRSDNRGCDHNGESHT